VCTHRHTLLPVIFLIFCSIMYCTGQTTSDDVVPCGSIMSGQRREFDTMIPLSMLKLSTGRPAICHARILTASPRIALSENVLELGIFFETHFLCQSFIQSYTHTDAPQFDCVAVIRSVVLKRSGETALSPNSTMPTSPKLGLRGRHGFVADVTWKSAWWNLGLTLFPQNFLVREKKHKNTDNIPSG